MGVLIMDDGRRIRLGERTHGGSKNETRFGVVGSRPVVVKIQRTHGRLADEKHALEFLTAVGANVPRVIGSGTTPDGLPFLVISRERGSHAETPEGWARFGRDLAGLAELSTDGWPLARVSTTDFVVDHRARLETVRALLTDGIADTIYAAIALVETEQRLVLTHGDPGTGNYLDSGDDRRPGVLLDWETASVSPFGLDLGRAVFIAMLDLRRTGIPDRLCAALISGYRERSERAAQLNENLFRAWVTIAGLQFIHGRHKQLLVPERTPQVAAAVLASYLTTVR